MLEKLGIKNYKSIDKLELKLGRVNVFIGENGSGKSNILEAIALGAAATSRKLDNEFLAIRGIRVTEPKFMRSAFDKENLDREIKLYFQGKNNTELNCVLAKNNNRPYSRWIDKTTTIDMLEIGKTISELRTSDLPLFPDIPNAEELTANEIQEIRRLKRKERAKALEEIKLPEFLIYSPQYSCLRTFEKEGQIEPLGINGEGLFKLLKVLSLESEGKKLNEVKEKLELIDWFEDLEIPSNLYATEQNLQIVDRYLDSGLFFHQKSTNEGFLFLLFYFSLFISDHTPKFFAIDNIDTSLNPKLCRRLITELAKLAVESDRQVIFTTHNPAILDGLNLGDDQQRLFVIERNKLGHTKAQRILKPEPLPGQQLVRLSEAFLRGYIGGLPKNF